MGGLGVFEAAQRLENTQDRPHYPKENSDFTLWKDFNCNSLRSLL